MGKCFFFTNYSTHRQPLLPIPYVPFQRYCIHYIQVCSVCLVYIVCSVSLFPHSLCIFFDPLQSSFYWSFPEGQIYWPFHCHYSPCLLYPIILYIICWIGNIFTWVKSQLVWKGRWRIVSHSYLSHIWPGSPPLLCLDIFSYLYLSRLSLYIHKQM